MRGHVLFTSFPASGRAGGPAGILAGQPGDQVARQIPSILLHEQGRRVLLRGEQRGQHSGMGGIYR